MLHEISVASTSEYKAFSSLRGCLDRRCFSAPALANAAIIVNDTWQDGTDSDPAVADLFRSLV